MLSSKSCFEYFCMFFLLKLYHKIDSIRGKKILLKIWVLCQSLKNIFLKPVLTFSFKYLYLRYGFPSFGLGKGMEAKFNMA